MDGIAATISDDQWKEYQIREGSKGPIVAESAFQRVIDVRDRVPGSEVWLVLRSSFGAEPELKAYLSNAPAHISYLELVRTVGMRWPVEIALEDGEDQLGMDENMVRSWLGWHHHMTECILPHHFLVRVQQRLEKERRH